MPRCPRCDYLVFLVATCEQCGRGQSLPESEEDRVWREEHEERVYGYEVRAALRDGSCISCHEVRHRPRHWWQSMFAWQSGAWFECEECGAPHCRRCAKFRLNRLLGFIPFGWKWTCQFCGQEHEVVGESGG